MRKKPLLLILATFFWVIGTAMAAPYIIMDEPALEGAVVLFGDLLHRGRIDCVIGLGQSVYLMDGETKEELIRSVPGQITALAMGDLTGDLRNNLIVGTDGAGAVYLYSLRGGKWEREAEPCYLWNTITCLEIHDFNNDGWGDVIALTANGEITIFLSWEGKLYPFWKSPAHEVVTNLQVLDIDQDGRPDVIYTLKSGYVGILTWADQEFVTLWENYPWGSIDSLAVLPFAGSPEWLVITSQKMLYGWKWKDGEVVSNRHFHASELGEQLFFIPDEGLVSFSQTTGMSLFELHSSGVTELWRVPGVPGCEIFYVDSQFILRDGDLNYYRLVPSSGQWTISLDGRDITGSIEVFEWEGRLYFNLSQIGPELGFSVYHLQDWYFLRDNRYLKINPLLNRVEYNGITTPHRGSLLEKDGLPYGSSDIFPLFGFMPNVDAARRKVTLGRNWGWWVY